MKKLLLLIGFCVLSISSYSQDAINKLFSEYQDNDAFKNVFISQKMFGLMANVESDDADNKEILDLVKDLSGLRILTSTEAETDFYSNAVSKLKSNGYEELMTVKENEENIIFFTNEGDKINELVLISSELSRIVMMSFQGDVDLNKIAKLAKTLDIEGAEHLEKLQEKK